MAQPQTFFTNAFIQGGSANESAGVTFSISIENAFEIQVPIMLYYGTTNISAGAQVNIYRSTDNSNTYETTGVVVASFPSGGQIGVSATTMRQDINLSRGIYVGAIFTGGNGISSIISWAIGTCEVVSCYS